MLDLMKGTKKMGKLIIRCEKVQSGNGSIWVNLEFLMMKFKAEKLTNTDSYFDWWNKSDPYLKFLKIRADNSYISVAQTEVIANSLNPNWRTIEIPLLRLATDKASRFKYFSWYSEFSAGIKSPKGKSISSLGRLF